MTEYYFDPKFLAEVEAIILEAGKILTGYFGAITPGEVEEKETNSLVSKADKETELFLLEHLENLLPGSGFLAEESAAKKSANGLDWIIDPLDGTTNFLFQIPSFCISVALAKDNDLLLGIVYDPLRHEVFHAQKDRGAFLNKKKIQVADRQSLDQALIAIGFPYTDFSMLDGYIEAQKWLCKNSRGVRRLGAAALDLAYVASGRFDGFFEYSLQPWDAAAGALLVKEAGGTVTDFVGEENYLHTGKIVAASRNIHPQLLNLVKQYCRQ